MVGLVRKVAEEAVRLFITNDKVNCAGLILAGSADFKTELGQSDMFDMVRLRVVGGWVCACYLGGWVCVWVQSARSTSKPGISESEIF